MTVKILTAHHLDFLSLKGNCTGSSESILVKMPHCWKSHVAVHIVIYVSGVVVGICHRSGLASSTQIMPLYAGKCQRSGSKKDHENFNGVDTTLFCTGNQNNEMFWH